MTIQTAVLIETLVELGAEVRWASAAISSPPRTTPPRRSPRRASPVFAYKGETLEEYWEFTTACSTGRTAGPELIVDDGGDATAAGAPGHHGEKDPAVLDKPTTRKRQS